MLGAIFVLKIVKYKDCRGIKKDVLKLLFFCVLFGGCLLKDSIGLMVLSVFSMVSNSCSLLNDLQLFLSDFWPHIFYSTCLVFSLTLQLGLCSGFCT